MRRDVEDAPKKSLADVMAELRVIWETWSVSVGEHPEWITGAAYGRESRADSLQGFSPGAQLRSILEDAARRGIWIPWGHVFFDQLTGKTDQRVGFQALHQAGLRDELRAVIMFHSSRWARNALLSRRYKEDLRNVASRSSRSTFRWMCRPRRAGTWSAPSRSATSSSRTSPGTGCAMA